MNLLLNINDVNLSQIFFLDKKTKESLINVGSGFEMSILNYAKFILRNINLKCKIVLDRTKFDGTPRKIIDSSIARGYGWIPKIDLTNGFNLTLKSYLLKYSK